MKKFLIRIFLFVVPLVVYVLLVPYMISINNGPSTMQQIKRSFSYSLENEYNLLVLGNSRCYRGINPDKLDIKSYNFAHDNDSYNQIYYKLKFLENKNKQFDYLVLGVDYFQFSFISSTRNYVYFQLLPIEYRKDYEQKSLIKELLNHYISNANPEKLEGVSLKKTKKIPFIKNSGQYIKPGTAKKEDFVERNSEILPIQEDYFNKILNFCKENNIKVFLVTLPMRDNEIQAYKPEEISHFHNYINNYINDNVVYLDYSRAKQFNINDFTDFTHLNQNATNEFSELLNDDILSTINQN